MAGPGRWGAWRWLSGGGTQSDVEDRDRATQAGGGQTGGHEVCGTMGWKGREVQRPGRVWGVLPLYLSSSYF